MAAEPCRVPDGAVSACDRRLEARCHLVSQSGRGDRRREPAGSPRSIHGVADIDVETSDHVARCVRLGLVVFSFHEKPDRPFFQGDL